MSDLYQVGVVGNHVLKVSYDQDCESPREWENLGTMVCWHRRYTLGDEHNYSSPEEFLRELILEDVQEKQWDRLFDKLEEMSLEDMLELAEEKAFILPLYLYDHSGITISTSPFSCPWDSGQVGWVYVTKKQVREEYGVKRISQKTKAKALSVLRSEVDTYDQYLRGDVYGFQLYQLDRDKLTEAYGEEDLSSVSIEDIELFLTEIDSCWGFFGDDFMENGILDQLGVEYKELVQSLEYYERNSLKVA